MIQYSWLIPALPALAFVLIALLTKRSKGLSASISIGVMAVCLALSVCLFLHLLALDPAGRVFAMNWTWLSVPPWQANMGVLIDPLSVNMLLVVTLVSLLVQVYSLGYLQDDERLSTYYSYLSLFTASMLLLVVSTNFLQIFVGWELVGVSSYLLVGFWYFKPEAAEAAKKAFVVNRIGDVGFLMGVAAIGMTFNNFDFTQVEALVTQGVAHGTYTSGFVSILALLLFCGAVGKSAQFPLHVWLPDAMEGPTPVSALIHAATMVAAGVYMVARTFPLFSADLHAMTVVAYVGGFTALFAASIALTQDDIKRILAYSTLSQLGYMMLALGAGGYTAGMFHLTTHACFKALLFLGAGSVIHAVHSNDIWKMGALMKPMRVTGVTFLIAALAISGVPPLAGFWSKDEIFAAVRDSSVPGHQWLLAAAVFTAFLTAFYMFRLFFVVFLGEARSPQAAHESPKVMTVPLLILAVLSISAGWLNWPGWDAFSRFVYEGPAPHPESFDGVLALFSSLVALAGLTLSGLFYYWKVFSAQKAADRFHPLYLLLKNKYYVDEFYGWLVRKFTWGLASLFDWLDRQVIDGGLVDGLGRLTQDLGGLLRFTQTGSVQNYALVILAAVAVIYLCVSF
ncbi:MAG TPA: NADH-quinone oxidoreductase subunit L [bacterium]|nr:NADH-quinone oxidoreductase subunit L [bacterium]